MEKNASRPYTASERALVSHIRCSPCRCRLHAPTPKWCLTPFVPAASARRPTEAHFHGPAHPLAEAPTHQTVRAAHLPPFPPPEPARSSTDPPFRHPAATLPAAHCAPLHAPASCVASPDPTAATLPVSRAPPSRSRSRSIDRSEGDASVLLHGPPRSGYAPSPTSSRTHATIRATPSVPYPPTPRTHP